MDTAGEVDQENTGRVSDAAIARRKLLKAAVGTGVAAAVYSAPKISVVPAYGLTTSNRSDSKCYGIGFSSNNPNGKGWMKLGDQPGSGNLQAPSAKTTDGCPGDGTWTDSSGSHSGAADCSTIGLTAPAPGPVRYTWTIPNGEAGGTTGLTIQLTGCVSNAGTTFTVSGLPTGYCLSWYNSGRGSTATPTTCGTLGSLLSVGVGQVTMSTRTTGSISSLGLPNCTGTGGIGKVYWTFDVKPCP